MDRSKPFVRCCLNDKSKCKIDLPGKIKEYYEEICSLQNSLSASDIWVATKHNLESDISHDRLIKKFDDHNSQIFSDGDRFSKFVEKIAEINEKCDKLISELNEYKKLKDAMEEPKALEILTRIEEQMDARQIQEEQDDEDQEDEDQEQINQEIVSEIMSLVNEQSRYSKVTKNRVMRTFAKVICEVYNSRKMFTDSYENIYDKDKMLKSIFYNVLPLLDNKNFQKLYTENDSESKSPLNNFIKFFVNELISEDYAVDLAFDYIKEYSGDRKIKHEKAKKAIQWFVDNAGIELIEQKTAIEKEHGEFEDKSKLDKQKATELIKSLDEENLIKATPHKSVYMVENLNLEL